MRLQNEWFDLKVNQDSLGGLRGTIGDNLPFTAVPEYPSFPRPCFLFESKGMLLQCLSRHLTFVVIYWVFLFSLKIHASFCKKRKVGNVFVTLPLYPGTFLFLSAESSLHFYLLDPHRLLSTCWTAARNCKHVFPSAIKPSHIKAISYLFNPNFYLYFIILPATFFYCYLFMIPTASADFYHRTADFTATSKLCNGLRCCMDAVVNSSIRK